MGYKFEIIRDRAGEFRVFFRYNSEIIFSTAGYASKRSANAAINSMKKNGPDAEVVDRTEETHRARKPVSSAASPSSGVTEERCEFYIQPWRESGQEWPIFIEMWMNEKMISLLEVHPDEVIHHNDHGATKNAIEYRDD